MTRQHREENAGEKKVKRSDKEHEVIDSRCHKTDIKFACLALCMYADPCRPALTYASVGGRYAKQ